MLYITGTQAGSGDPCFIPITKIDLEIERLARKVIFTNNLDQPISATGGYHIVSNILSVDVTGGDVDLTSPIASSVVGFYGHIQDLVIVNESESSRTLSFNEAERTITVEPNTRYHGKINTRRRGDDPGSVDIVEFSRSTIS